MTPTGQLQSQIADYLARNGKATVAEISAAIGRHHSGVRKSLLKLCAANKVERTEGIVPVCNVRCVYYGYVPERGRGPVGEFDSRVTVREWVPMGAVDPWMLPREFFKSSGIGA